MHLWGRASRASRTSVVAIDDSANRYFRKHAGAAGRPAFVAVKLRLVHKLMLARRERPSLTAP
jgi:hypothetical protein